jgi:hypothetical protein
MSVTAHVQFLSLGRQFTTEMNEIRGSDFNRRVTGMGAGSITPPCRAIRRCSKPTVLRNLSSKSTHAKFVFKNPLKIDTFSRCVDYVDASLAQPASSLNRASLM